MESLKLSSFAAHTHLLACCAAQLFAVDSVLASLSVFAWLQWMLITKNVMFLSFSDVEPYINQWPSLADYKNKGKAVVESNDENGADDDSDAGYGDSDDDDLSSDDDVEDSDDEDEDSDEDDISDDGGDGDGNDDDDDEDNDSDDDDTDTDDEDDDDEEDASPNKNFK